MKHILVSGGAGYIGSHACKLLARQGYIPVTFDSLVTGWASAVKFGPFIQGDLLNRDALDAVFAKYEPVAVKHFAALSQVGEATHEPGRYWRNNVLGSLNLVEAMVDAGCKHIVFSSTVPPTATKMASCSMRRAPRCHSMPMAPPNALLKRSCATSV